MALPCVLPAIQPLTGPPPSGSRPAVPLPRLVCSQVAIQPLTHPLTIGASMSQVFASNHDTPSEAVISRQQQLEEHAMAEGARLFRDRLERAKAQGQEATTGAGFPLVRNGIEPLAAAIEFTLREMAATRGPKHIIFKTVPQLCPPPAGKETDAQASDRLKRACDVAAYMTLRVVLNAALARTDVRTVAYDVADLLTDQIRYSRLKAEAPALFNYKMQGFDTANYAHRKRSLDATLRTATVRRGDGVESTVDVSDVELTQTQRLALGIRLVDLLIQSTDLVEKTEAATSKRKSRNYRQATTILTATDDTLQWLEAGNHRLEFLTPVALPMVEAPLPWGSGQRGGYRHALRYKYPFVRRTSKEHGRSLDAVDMPLVYDAVNRIQGTAWRINGDVLALVEEIVERGGGIAGLAEVRIAEEPQRPRTDEGFEAILTERRRIIREATRAKEEPALVPLPPELASYAEEWRRWKRQKAAFMSDQRERGIARRELDRLLNVARMFKDDPALYFVWNVDFRGRVYPVVGNSGISPQGNDRGKALLTFAQGKPLGEHGARYLAQHGMGCLGETPDGLKVSRLTIADRVRWIEEHGEMIRQVAEDPFTFTWWARTDAKGTLAVDEPLMFYAFCREWARLLAWRDAGLPDADFVSALPCFTDGTCNGLQHFGGLLACADTGKAVNLVPTTPGMTPSDIYSEVMEKAQAIILADAADPSKQEAKARTVTKKGPDGVKKETKVSSPSDGDLARIWLTSGYLSRSFFKRPVMTFPYGSKVYGFRDQFIDTLQHAGSTVAESKRLWETARRHFSSAEALAKAPEGKAPGDLLHAAVSYLASVTMLAIEATVVKAAEGMDWLQRAARLVAANGQCVTWTVPVTGFKVRQEYFETRTRQVETILCGKVYKPAVLEPTATPKAQKQANSMSPNFIHSLDAAALMLSVRQAAQDGVDSFAMIHDSYGAPAGDCMVIGRAARQAFVNLYTRQDVLGGLLADLTEQVSVEQAGALAEDFPKRGDLDVAGVLASDFFFA